MKELSATTDMVRVEREGHLTIITIDRPDAREALDIGIVNEVVTGDVLAAARRWAQDILACSPMSIRATKEAARRSETRDLFAAMSDEWEWPAMKAMLTSRDGLEGPQAFAEKCKPDWRGH